MKKNGYTLVELILTIALLATASTVIIVNIMGIKGNQDKDKLERYKEAIESAACAYIDTISNVSKRNTIKQNCKNNSGVNNNTCYVTLTELVKDQVALVDPDLKDPETNCTAESKKEKESVRVYIHFVSTKDKSGYEKKCEFQRTKEVTC